MATFARLARACLAAACLALPFVIVAAPSPAGAVEAKETAATATKEKRPPTPGQLAARERMKTCGAEWRALKTAGNTGSRTWREFSSTCMKQARR
ncbi:MULTISPECIES: hypothetical protein [unclassified Chelatococcus]|uniref:hypothetical protein n=1 Tax=unclassified Chelatococcus TaxID=2638111 RepID=UPI00031751CC|nr:MULTISPECIES: hypothetical protein [unclassified Chelatococcus]ALA19257.1 hypothetical protein AL346_19855 [Chelatococcus sp. CO-6]